MLLSLKHLTGINVERFLYRTRIHCMTNGKIKQCSRMLTKCPSVELMSIATVSQSLHQDVRVELTHKIHRNTEALSKQHWHWSHMYQLCGRPNRQHHKSLPVHLHRVRKKNIPDIFNCNLKKFCQMLIISDTRISDTTGDQMAVLFSTAPTICFCIIWRNKNNKILHFRPILPVRVFPDSAETDIRWCGN